jgi:hypothetical protein
VRFSGFATKAAHTSSEKPAENKKPGTEAGLFHIQGKP